MFVVIVGYRIYVENFSNKGIVINVTYPNDYLLSNTQERIPIELFIEPQWIPFTVDERYEPNIKLLELHGTSIHLDHVMNNGDEIYFSFRTTHHKNRNGEFIYNGIFHDDGTFTSPSPGEFMLHDIEQNEIPLGGFGFGPGADFSFGVLEEHQDRMKHGLNVKYTGFILYRYEQK